MDPLKCTICKYPLYATSNQFYCCSRNQRYCIICRGKECVKCHRPIDKKYELPKCRVCYTRAQDDQLLEPQCEAYYCGRCIVSRVLKNANNKDRNKGGGGREPYMLPCGHQIEAVKVDNFIKGNFCKVCGRKYDLRSDYELIDGHKCCFECIKYQRRSVENDILQCMACQKLMRKLTEVGSNISQGVVLCFACAKASCMEEERCQMEKGIKKAEEKQMVNNYVDNYLVNNQKPQPPPQPQQGQIPPQTSLKSQPQVQQPQQPPQQPKPRSDVYQIKVTGVKKQEPQLQPSANSPTKAKSPLKQRQKSPAPVVVNSPQNQQQIKGQGTTTVQQKHKEQRPKAQQVSQNLFQSPIKQNEAMNTTLQTSFSSQSQNPNSKITILQQFPPQSNQLTSPLPRLTIKKHMSMQTYIQKMKIPIETTPENIPYISCKQCDYELEKSQAFTIENSMHEIDYYCRLCYITMTNKQLFGFNMMPMENRLDKSRNMRGLSNQRHKIPSNLLNSGTDSNAMSKQKQQMSPGASLNSNYLSPLSSTQGSPYLPPQPNPMKKSDNTLSTHINTYSNTASKPYNPNPYHEKMSATMRVVTTGSNNGGRECPLCKGVGASMITTTDRGVICFNCYYSKRK